MVQELLGKYIWLVDTFTRAGRRGLSLSEVQDRWYDRYDAEYPRRTFNHHREAVAELFGIEIGCDRSTNRYFIEGSDEVQDVSESSRWLINTFTVNNLLSQSKDRLSGRVSVEDVPSGQTWLTTIMDAMTGSFTLHLRYRKYASEIEDILDVDPYAVKEFAKRWYLIGYCHQRMALRVYGLDRITALEATYDDFDLPRDFDVEELFRGSFGIYIPHDYPVTITFRAGLREAAYIRDLPLHKSQKEIASDDDGSTFTIEVCPGKDLMMELCRHGSNIEILSPEFIRRELAEELGAAAKIYRKE